MIEKQLSQELARAESALAEKQALRQKADEKVSAITARINDLISQREEITKRRADGKKSETDAAEFALLASDIELLGTALKAAQETAVAIGTEAEEEAQRRARYEWETHQRKSQLAALVSKAQEIDALLCRAIGEIRSIGKTQNPAEGLMVGDSLSAVWRPSQTLQQCIRREFAPL